MTDPKNEHERMPFKLDIIHKMLRIKQAFFFFGTDLHKSYN